MTEAIKKTTKIHTRLPPGGILIFLTGQNEITGVCRKLEAKFGVKALERKRRQRQLADSAIDEHENSDGGVIRPVQGMYAISFDCLATYIFSVV